MISNLIIIYMQSVISHSLNRNTITWLAAFSISMALLESAVVVYLRALYYPQGFTVALKLIDQKILLTELLRELATIVMLYAVASLLARNKVQRLAWFLFCFAVWDIFYYVWLKVILDWPESFFTWDILFLIPITWLGPVWAPLVCSITMILLSMVIIKYDASKLKSMEWTFLLAGSLAILSTFMFDYGKIMHEHNLWRQYSSLLSNPVFLKATSNYIPKYYLWELFCLGELLILSAIYLIFKRNQTNHYSYGS